METQSGMSLCCRSAPAATPSPRPSPAASCSARWRYGSAPGQITDASGAAAEAGFGVCFVLFDGSGGAPLASAASVAVSLVGMHVWDSGQRTGRREAACLPVLLCEEGQLRFATDMHKIRAKTMLGEAGVMEVLLDAGRARLPAPLLNEVQRHRG